jgi:RNA polymerase sporulation-specific sigma factor
MSETLTLNEQYDYGLKDLIEQIQKGNKQNIIEFYNQFKVKDFCYNNTERKQDHFIVDLNELDEETLVLLHQNTTWLAPSYFLRKKFFGKWKELTDETLLTLAQTLSPKAKEELYFRYNNNLKKGSDELLVLMAQDNNSDALDVLFERYLPIVKRIIRRLEKKFFFRGFDTNDLIQEGVIGLFKSKDDYKIERKTKFKDFSRHVIEKHIGTLILRSSNYKNKVLNESFSYHSPIGSESEVTFEQMLKSEANSPETVTVNRETYYAILDKLTDLEKEVLEYYALGLSYEEIGELVDKKKKAVDNTIQRIRKKGKQYLENYLN